MPRSTNEFVAPRARIEHLHVVIERLFEGLCAGLVAAWLLHRPGPCGEIIPARAARCFRIRRHDAHARFREIAPIVNAFGIAGAHEKHNCRRIGRAVIRELFLPVPTYEIVRGQRIDIGRDAERDHIRLLAVEHLARLCAGTAVGRANGDLRPGGFVVPGRKELVVSRVEFARGVVRDVEQRGVGEGVHRGEKAAGEKQGASESR